MFSWTPELHLIGFVTAGCCISEGIVERQFSFIISEFLSDRKQRLNDKVSGSVDVVLGVSLRGVLGPLLFILYTPSYFTMLEIML